MHSCKIKINIKVGKVFFGNFAEPVLTAILLENVDGM